MSTPAQRSPSRVDDPPRTARARWWTWTNAAFAACAAAIPLWTLARNHADLGGDWSYSAGEWLVNYSNGPVRRGLAGEAIVSVPGLPDQWALEVWVAAIAVAVAVLFGVLVRRCITRLDTFWPLLLWTLPGGFIAAQIQYMWQPYGSHMTQFAFRKEQLGYAIVLAAALLWSARPALTRRRFVAVSTGLVVALFAYSLVHEGVAAMCAAAVSLGSLAVSGSFRPTLRVWAALAPLGAVGAGLAVALVHRGFTVDISRMWAAVDEHTRSWMAQEPGWVSGLGTDGIPLAFVGISTGATDGPGFAKTWYLDTGVWMWWAITAAAVVGSALVVLMLVDSSPAARRRAAALLGVLAAVSVPLFILGYDWGRWIVLVSNLFVIVALLAILNSSSAPQPARPNAVHLAIGASAVAMGLLVGVPELGVPKGLLFADPPPPAVAAQGPLPAADHRWLDESTGAGRGIPICQVLLDLSSAASRGAT